MALLAAAGLVMILSGLGAYYATDQLSPFSVGNLVLGPLLLVGAAVGQSLRTTGFRGAHSRRIALRWIGILVAVAAGTITATGATSNWGASLDLTSARLYTLAPQTLDLLKEIDASDGEPIRLFLFTDAYRAPEVDPLVRAYESASSRLQVRRIPMGQAPPEARPHVVYEPTLLVCRGTRCEPTGFSTEETITAALIRLLSSGARLAYFMIGHGEIDLSDESDDGYSLLNDRLAAEGFTTRGWIGPARDTPPEDAALLVVGAPARDLLEAEIETIDHYVATGGRVLVLREPGSPTNLDEWLGRWGFDLPSGIVLDRRNSPLVREPRGISLIVNGFTDHPIVKRMSPRTMLLIPGAAPVIAARKPAPNDRMRALAFSSPYSWLETDVAAAFRGAAVEPDPDEQQAREIPIAAAGRYPRGEVEARIVVFGDRDFVSNRLLGALYNADLLLNAVHWLVEQDPRISLRPKGWTPRQDPLTLQETLSFFYFFAFALPELLLLLGIHAWYRQRH